MISIHDFFRNQQEEKEEDREKKGGEERVECMAVVLDLLTKSERGRERAAGEGPKGPEVAARSSSSEREKS